MSNWDKMSLEDQKQALDNLKLGPKVASHKLKGSHLSIEVYDCLVIWERELSIPCQITSQIKEFIQGVNDGTS